MTVGIGGFPPDDIDDIRHRYPLGHPLRSLQVRELPESGRAAAQAGMRDRAKAVIRRSQESGIIRHTGAAADSGIRARTTAP